MAFLADLFSRNSLSSLGVLSKSQILTPFEKNIRTPYFSRLFSVLGINSVIFVGFLSSTWYHLVPLDSTTFHLTPKARNAVWGNSPRVRIPNSPPEKVITASAVMAFYFVWDSKDERYRATVRWTVVTASDQATAVAQIESLTLRQTKPLENIRFLRDLFFEKTLKNYSFC